MLASGSAGRAVFTKPLQGTCKGLVDPRSVVPNEPRRGEKRVRERWRRTGVRERNCWRAAGACSLQSIIVFLLSG